MQVIKVTWFQAHIRIIVVENAEALRNFAAWPFRKQKQQELQRRCCTLESQRLDSSRNILHTSIAHGKQLLMAASGYLIQCIATDRLVLKHAAS